MDRKKKRVLVIHVSGASNIPYVLYRKICDEYAHDPAQAYCHNLAGAALGETISHTTFSLVVSPLPRRDNRNKKSVEAGDLLTWWRVSGVYQVYHSAFAVNMVF